MAEVHGKNTVILVGGTDLSEFTDNSTFPRTADVHDLTTYGKNSHKNKGGLKGGTFSMGGVYDDGASDTPATVFAGNEGDDFEITRRPQGSGSGKPQQAFTGVLNNYTESNPVADFIRWTADFTLSDDVDDTAQS